MTPKLTGNQEALLEELRTNLYQQPALWRPLIERLLVDEAQIRAVEEAMQLSEESLRVVWENPKDDIYDDV